MIHRLRPVCLLLLILSLLIAAQSALAADSADLTARFTEANNKAEAGDLAGALALYDRILAEAPKADNVLFERGRVKRSLKDASGAKADLDRAISLNPKDPEMYFFRGVIRYESRDFPGSLTDLNQAIQLFADDPIYYSVRAKAHLALKKPEAALEDLTRAIELDPEDNQMLTDRADLHRTMGNSSAALVDYNRFLRLKPDDIEALMARARIKFDRMDWSGAIEDAQKTAVLDPKDTWALLGYAQFAAGDYRAAAVSLAKAADKAEGNPKAEAYPLFIRYFAALRSDIKDARLASTWGKWEHESWLHSLGKFIAGALAEDQLEFDAKETATDPDIVAGQMCEAHFYIGLKRLQQGDKTTARQRFAACLALNQKGYIEHTLAQAELKRLSP